MSVNKKGSFPSTPPKTILKSQVDGGLIVYENDQSWECKARQESRYVEDSIESVAASEAPKRRGRPLKKTSSEQVNLNDFLKMNDSIERTKN
jgi:hypothetical protein